jgi:hypothetical protein
VEDQGLRRSFPLRRDRSPEQQDEREQREPARHRRILY